MLATVCDGIVECSGNRDENWVCTQSKLPYYGLLLLFCLILGIVLVIKIFREMIIQKNVGESSFPTEIEEETFLENHEKQEYKYEINIILHRMKLLLPKNTRIERYQNFHSFELKYHKDNIAETKRYFKC